MKTPLDPPRLLCSADADPVLRHALQVIREDVPTTLALGALADAAERGLRAGAGKAAASAAAPALVAKLALVTIAGGALAYFALSGAHTAVPEGGSAIESARSANVSNDPSSKPSLDEKRPVPAPAASSARAEEPSASASVAGEPAAASDQPAPAGAETRASSSGSASGSGSGSGSGSERGAVPRIARGPEGAPPSIVPGAASPAPATPKAVSSAGDTRAAASERKASEMDVLESAQQALLHEPRRALDLLAEHRRLYPRGKFSQERDVLALEAYQRLHDRNVLHEGARRFFERYPNSPHRARVNKLLEGLP